MTEISNFLSSSLVMMTLKDIVSYAAIITTVGMNCTGLPICRKIAKNGSVGEVSAFPFVAGACCTGIWMVYGQYINDSTLIIVNTIGFLLQFGYVLTYYRFCHQKSNINKQLLGALCAILSLTMYVIHLGDDTAQITKSFGLCACFGSIVFCGSPLSQLSVVIKMKSTENLPFLLIFVTFICTGLWSLYGYLIDDIFVKVPNILGMLLAAVQLSLFIIYPRKTI